MAQNAFQLKSDAQLLAIGQHAATVIPTADPGYGTDAAQNAALTAANTALAAAITAAQTARDASKAATQQKLAARQASIAALSSIGATIYNNPAVTDQMIANAGYAVHDTTATKHAPIQPTGLAATPDSSGTVLLAWSGGGNVYGTIYSVEGRALDTDPWTTVTNTKRRSVSVPGFTPGQTYWFRVTASNNGLTSVASAPVAIWGETGVLELPAAA